MCVNVELALSQATIYQAWITDSATPACGLIPSCTMFAFHRLLSAKEVQ